MNILAEHWFLTFPNRVVSLEEEKVGGHHSVVNDIKLNVINEDNLKKNKHLKSLQKINYFPFFQHLCQSAKKVGR